MQNFCLKLLTSGYFYAIMQTLNQRRKKDYA